MSKGKTILNNVEDILRKYPNTRGDDKLLIACYWREIDKLTALNMDFVNYSTPSESITRARRLIQANGMYLPSDEIIAIRKNRESRFKNAIRNGEII